MMMVLELKAIKGNYLKDLNNSCSFSKFKIYSLIYKHRDKIGVIIDHIKSYKYLGFALKYAKVLKKFDQMISDFNRLFILLCSINVD